MSDWWPVVLLIYVAGALTAFLVQMSADREYHGFWDGVAYIVLWPVHGGIRLAKSAWRITRDAVKEAA